MIFFLVWLLAYDQRLRLKAISNIWFFNNCSFLILLDGKSKANRCLISGRKKAKIEASFFKDIFLIIGFYKLFFYFLGININICKNKNNLDINIINIDKKKEIDNLCIGIANVNGIEKPDINIADINRYKKMDNSSTNIVYINKLKDLSISIADVDRNRRTKDSDIGRININGIKDLNLGMVDVN